MIYVAGEGTQVRKLVDELNATGIGATCGEDASRDVPEAEKTNAAVNAIVASTRLLLVPGTWEADPASLLDVLIADGAGIPIALASPLAA